LKRRFFWSRDAGVRCENCGELWRGDRSAYIDALANRMTAPRRFMNGPERGMIYGYNRRVLTDGGGQDV